VTDERIAAYIAKTVAEAPPITREQAARLAVLFWPGTQKAAPPKRGDSK
jgi:hypothetical protein